MQLLPQKTMMPFRLYDTNSKKMLMPPELMARGVFMSPMGQPVQLKEGKVVILKDVVVMYQSGLATSTGTPIWQDDVVEVDVPTEFGSTLKAQGVMQWDKFNGKFSIYIPHPPALSPQGDFPVMGGKILGNVHEQPDILKK